MYILVYLHELSCRCNIDKYFMIVTLIKVSFHVLSFLS